MSIKKLIEPHKRKVGYFLMSLITLLIIGGVLWSEGFSLLHILQVYLVACTTITLMLYFIGFLLWCFND